MSFSKTIVISILVWMEDDFESPEDLYNFEAIGNWRVVLQDNGKYEKSLFLEWYSADNTNALTVCVFSSMI